MKILIVDGQGGGIGRQLVEALKREGERDLFCVGTNAIATSAMLRAGAARAAQGRTPWRSPAARPRSSPAPWASSSPMRCWAKSRRAWPLPWGRAAPARCSSPVNQCGNFIVGVPAGQTTAQLVAQAVEAILRPAEGA